MTIPAGPGTITDNHTGDHKIIVFGASAGGFDALKKLVTDLPPDFNAPIFIVWHMAATVKGILPQVLNKLNSIYAAHAYDGEPIIPNRIYVAQPDCHMLIEQGTVRITHGPKENHFRPAVDPLFRSAAYAYGNRVIGVILSGALDDGTAGLWTIKEYGGTTIVQDPLDAEIPSMPESALRHVEVDHAIPVAGMADLLTRLAVQPASQNNSTAVKEDIKTKMEIRIAAEGSGFKAGIMQLGELTPFACPECHGVLVRLKDGDLVRYRCHTGHAFSVNTLMLSLTENIEASLYNAIRGIEESIMLLNHIGDHFAENNQPKEAGLYFKKAQEAGRRADRLRQSVIMPVDQRVDGIPGNKEAIPPGQDG